MSKWCATNCANCPYEAIFYRASLWPATRRNWRRHPDSNWGIEVLQTSALPLGYAAKIYPHKADDGILNPHYVLCQRKRGYHNKARILQRGPGVRSHFKAVFGVCAAFILFVGGCFLHDQSGAGRPCRGAARSG